MIYDTEDTIAAVATPAGYGGIAIIRVSGSRAHETVDKIFARPDGQSFAAQANNSIRYGHIKDECGGVLDEVLVSKMKAPHTYTAEDTAEINCHGGYAAAESVLELLLKNGVRAAEPGEFSKRAFLNGRIDLSQAEAVSDIITAKTSSFAKIAAMQISGALSEAINAIKQSILALLAALEVTIQYPEYDVPEVTDAELRSRLELIKSDIEKLAAGYARGAIMRDGLKTAIVGKPNVGKSLLLNKLSGKDRAIVTDIAGTTRDVVDELINIGGVPVRLMDTAGIRESSDTVEAIGIGRSLAAVEEAEFVLFVLDGSLPPDSDDERIRAAVSTKAKAVLLNKSDLGIGAAAAAFVSGENCPVIKVSAKTGDGLEEAVNTLRDFVCSDAQDTAAGRILVNARHKKLIDSALLAVESAISSIDNGLPVDMVQIDIKDAWESLGAITGETADEDIVDEIFKNFCLGK